MGGGGFVAVIASFSIKVTGWFHHTQNFAGSPKGKARGLQW